MKVLITGICGFVGSTLAAGLRQAATDWEILGLDNLLREGSEANRLPLKRQGVKVIHADIRMASDVTSLPPADWVIDAAANASVLAGLGYGCGSRQLIEHNLFGTVNLLEYCKQHRAGFLLLSTSRVYSLRSLAGLEMEVAHQAYVPKANGVFPEGFSPRGVSEGFSTAPPVSLYGNSKLASESLALEYGEMFEFPVWINRCGVMAGAGQFGRPDQGVFAYWINGYLRGLPLKYLGFGGTGFQVRDCFHPRDLVTLLRRQMEQPAAPRSRIQNISGGSQQSLSLAQLSEWCAARFGRREIQREPVGRPFDVPWLVLDATQAGNQWGWEPRTSLETILTEIARHAEQNPHWLELSGVL
ncbi:MAG: NAD-dependent epimerase/dehydratase family protein [Verrucomicrobiota bacterium]